MANAFKRKRKPDSPSMSMSLEEHIAATERDPHPQYAKISDLDVISSGISFVTTIADLGNYASTQNTHVVPNAYLANIFYSEISANTTRMTSHTAPITQESVLNSTGVLPHTDNDGLSLYAARTHTHTLSDLGAAAWNHNHDELYSPLGHTHNYANAVHYHSEYVTYAELDSVGIYSNSVNVAGSIDESAGSQEGQDDMSYFDCNDFTIQGNYYLKPTGTYEIENGPNGEMNGLLTVYVSSSEDGTTSDIVQFFYGEISWKRSISVVTVENTIVDDETGEEITSSERQYTFGQWMPLVETLPIGSLMFSTHEEVPQGYLEANGAEVAVSSYPALWAYAKSQSALTLSTNANYIAGKLDGCYAIAGITSTTSAHTITAAEVGQVYIYEDSGILKKLTTSNQDQYVGGSYGTVPVATVEAATSFRLPKLGGQFLRMWTTGQDLDSGRTLGSTQDPALPNVYGNFSALGYSGNSSYGSGVFYKTSQQTNTGVSTNGSNSGQVSFEFDASKNGTDLVYQQDEHFHEVIPGNTSVRAFIKAYNGSLLKQDVSESTLRSIISGLVSQYGYATTTTAGLIKLSTSSLVAGGSNSDTAVTPALLEEATHDYVAEIEVNGQTFTSVQHKVTLPDMAPAYGNTTVSITDDTTIKCTAMLDISEPSNIYKDFVVPYNLAESVYANGSYNLNTVTLGVTLKCTHASNSMGYPVGAVIPTPLCSYKSDSEAEYMASPMAIMFVDSNTNYTGTNMKQLKVRLYWPLMWYFKKFTPAAGDGSRSFPFIDSATNPTVEQITTECGYWTVVLNIHM